MTVLSARQRRELAYHARCLTELTRRVPDPLAVLDATRSRSWNAYWFMFERIRTLDLRGKRCLVFGCGLGQDALALAKLGADTYAFDLSPEQLAIAKQQAEKYDLAVHFEQMAGECLRYPDNFFDLVLAVDIIHHCEVPQAIAEIGRVSKPGAAIVFNEVYTHTVLQRVRSCRFIERCVYPLASRMIYGGFRYVTEDERKLDQRDVDLLSRNFDVVELRFFEAFIKRIVPNRPWLARLDTAFLSVSKWLGRWAAGRFVLFARRSAEALATPQLYTRSSTVINTP